MTDGTAYGRLDAAWQKRDAIRAELDARVNALLDRGPIPDRDRDREEIIVEYDARFADVDREIDALQDEVRAENQDVRAHGLAINERHSRRKSSRDFYEEVKLRPLKPRVTLPRPDPPPRPPKRKPPDGSSA